MYEVDLNYWAILVAGVAAYFIGMIWYMTLSKPWMKAAGFEGKTKEQMKEMSSPWSYVGSFLVGLVMAYILAHVLAFMSVETLADGLVAAFWMWLGFVATTSLKSLFWEKRSFNLWAINNGDHLLGLLAMAAILTLWT
ncbi:MAG: DUF1761 domain-containing protein [Candidatus Doudnabacteria bacterium]|nr:DUF1761 domain-containing protein [Candidatus Doudnabacteria bacterium]